MHNDEILIDPTEEEYVKAKATMVLSKNMSRDKIIYIKMAGDANRDTLEKMMATNISAIKSIVSNIQSQLPDHAA
jgi:ribonuclease PH